MQQIRVLVSYTDSAAMNLAIEEAIVRAVLEGEAENTIRFWTNPPCVVLGRFQAATLNCDLEYCKTEKIEVVRRESSGGAVYQDLGNWNHSIFLRDLKDFNITEEKSYEELSSLMVATLHKMGIPVSYSPPNDILLNGKKISGAAQFELYNTFLHHATLLVDTNFERMARSLRLPTEKFADKKASSIFERVTTLKKEGYKIDNIKSLAKTYAQVVEERFSLHPVYGDLTQFERDLAQELYEIKYNTAEWNIDLVPYSEHYQWLNYKLPLGLLQIGVLFTPLETVGDIEFSGDLSITNFEPFNELSKALFNCPLKKGEIVKRVRDSDVLRFGVEPEKFAEIILQAAKTKKDK